MPRRAFFTSYIVRIYRFEKNDPRSLVGVIEEVGRKGKRSFTNYNDLWEILSAPKPRDKIKKGGKHEVSGDSRKPTAKRNK